jgi:Zn finger protein HypA/HybF involved in hydrogenase expression
VIEMVEGRCMKCREQKEMKNAKQDKMANGRDCVKGECPKCGTKMFKIGKMK